MVVADYLDYLDRGVALDEGTDPDSTLLSQLITGVPGDSAAMSLARWPVAARRNADREGGRYPLVLWSSRHDVALYQSILSEYLASHGYVVAAVRRTGDYLLPPWRLAAAERPATLRAHVADLEDALETLSRLRSVSLPYALLSWSFGGEAAMALTADSTVPAPGVLVSLSSTAVSGWLYQASVLEDFHSSGRGVPLVLMAEAVRMDGTERLVPSGYRATESPAVYLRFSRMGHGDFNFLEGYLPALAGIERVQPWANGDEAALAGYPVVARLAVGALERYLKQTNDSLATAWPGELPPQVVELVQR